MSGFYVLGLNANEITSILASENGGSARTRGSFFAYLSPFVLIQIVWKFWMCCGLNVHAPLVSAIS